MRVLGIDPGTLVLGYGVVQEGEGGLLHRVTDGTISPPGELPQRLKGLYDGLLEVMRTYAPDEVAIESPFYAKNAVSTVKLGQVQGVVVLAAAHASLETSTYTPMEVKAAVVGYGNASKAQVREMVKRLLRIEGQLPFDASDALAVAICHIHSAQLKQRYQRYLCDAVGR